MDTDRPDLNASDIIPDAVAEHWQDSIPVHALLVIDAIRGDGSHGLHVVHDSGAPPWVLIGMMRSILVDLEARWVGEEWMVNDDEDS